MRLIGIVPGSQVEADVAFLQQATEASTPEEAIERAVARETNLLRQLAKERSVRIVGSNPAGHDVVYS